jgi:hypothetical protein
MNTQIRRRKVNIGIAYIAEVILDVIQSDAGKDNQSISTASINTQLDFNEVWGKDICRSVLEHMEKNGEVARGPGAASWRLTS